MVLFGSISSPFLLAAVLEKLITKECQVEFMKEALLNGLYVDNANFATDNESLLLEYFKVSREVMASGNFELRQWCSNNEALMVLAENENVAVHTDSMKVFGMIWHIA